MEDKSILLLNLEKIHTTEMGVARIKSRTGRCGRILQEDLDG